jgi:hypothetical protein
MYLTSLMKYETLIQEVICEIYTELFMLNFDSHFQLGKTRLVLTGGISKLESSGQGKTSL